MSEEQPDKHFKYFACPKCNVEWQPLELYFECPSCKMRYSGINNHTEHGLAMPDFLGKKGYHLGWNINGYECIYGSIDEIVDGKEIRLPWLPFTITPQELTELLAKPVMVHYLTPQEAIDVDTIDEEGTERLREFLERNK
jgi:hypothetical protein